MPALVLFAFGLVLRLLFVWATPDGGVGWHAGFEGDAGEWRAAAATAAHWNALSPDEQRVLLLPLRPPAMPWLVSLLWDGNAADVGLVRYLFLGLGATIAPLVWWLLRAHLAPRIVFTAAAWCAASSNLLLLSSGLHVETLYLTLVLLTLLVQQRLAANGAGSANIGSVANVRIGIAWGAMHGALCLLRAEHGLTFAAMLLLARFTGTAWRPLLLGGLAAAAVVTPWQLVANARTDAFNANAPHGAPPQPASPIPWDDAAIAAVRATPPFQHVPLFRFVGDTVHRRGGTRVRVGDLDVVREAYGCFPEPLPHAFVALYGGLNFFLGNTPEADAGFSRAALDRPLPLVGGAARFPPLAMMAPPAGRFTFEYPPHLDAIVNGTSRGLAEIASAPGAAAWRVARKLWHAMEGATGGIGGHALPIGLSGVRRQVDFVTATGAWATAWRVLVLAAAAAGLWSLRSVRALWPLLAFAATKLVVVAAVFGYARHGALCVPVVAVGLAALVVPRLGDRRWLAPVLLGAVLVLEVVRCLLGVAVHADGGAANAPLPPQDYRVRQLEFR